MSVQASSTDVNRAIRRLVWARLREVGFERRTARTAWRRWDEGVDVVNFQSFNSYLAGGVGCTTFSFAVNLGAALDYVPGLASRDPMRDPSALLGRLQAGDAGDDLGTPSSPHMALLVGFVARRAGMRDLARTNLMRARQFDGYRLIAEEIEAAIEQAG
jgi:hypothetical protein